jgi:hypothetical protein
MSSALAARHNAFTQQKKGAINEGRDRIHLFYPPHTAWLSEKVIQDAPPTASYIPSTRCGPSGAARVDILQSARYTSPWEQGAFLM